MKNKFTFRAFVFFFLLSSKLLAQNFWVPDSNFRNYLKSELPLASFTPLDSLITSDYSVQHRLLLSCSGLNVYDFDGIQYFISLKFFQCNYNQLTSLPHLPDSLVYLDCNYNFLTSLPVLPDSLVRLWCSHNALTSLPKLPSSLTDFGCGNNPISCLPVLPANLATLYYPNTYISCLPNLPSGASISPLLPICNPNNKSCDYLNTIGSVFKDDNGNGVKDLGDKGISLQINYSGGYSIKSDTSGYYSAISDTGNITYAVNIPNYYNPSSPVSQTVHVSNNSIQTINFGFQPIQTNINDLKINVVAYNPLRPGFKVNYKIHYQNIGTSSISNTIIKFVKPVLLSNRSSNPVASSSIGDTLFWNIGNLNPYQEGYITVLDSVSASAALNTSAPAYACIFPIVGDNNTLDNYSWFNTIIVGSCDPNDKSVSPKFINPNSTGFLEYNINFQNTGTDTAFSVMVSDTLSFDLNVTTIEGLLSSHPNTFWVEKNIAKWYFTNILLPDSNANEANSHGFVKFRIKQNVNLAIGTQIPNAANIYFDYNAAVVTNTIIVNVTPLFVPFIVAKKMQVFPNPVHQTVHLNSGNDKALGKVELLNSNGIIIETRTIPTSSFDWQVEQLPAAVYIFNGENWKVKVLKK